MASRLYELGLSLAAKLDPSLSKSFKQADKAVSSYDQAVNQLNRHQNNLDRLMKQREATMKAARAFNDSKLKVAQLGAQMKATKTPSAQLRAEFEKAKAEVTRMSAAYDKQMLALKKLRSESGLAGKSIRQLKLEEQQLAAAAEKAAAMQKMQGRIAAANAMRSAGAGRMTSGAGQIAAMAGMGMALTATLKPGMELEKQMSALGAVTKLTESQMAQLQERAVLLGRDTILSADQAAIGMANFVRAGYSVEEASKAMDAAGHVAVLTGKDFAEGSAFVLQALKSYSLGAEEAGRVSDVLANLMANSGLSAEKAAEKFQAVGPALRSMGVGLEESAGLIAAMDKLNLDSGKLKKMMVALKAPTTAQAKALNALGVSAARADGSQKDVLEIMGDLEKKLQGLPAATRDAKLTEIFSQRDMVAVKGILSSISNGELPDLISAMKKTGAAEKAAGKMTDNLWGDMQGLGSAIAYVAVRAFEALQPLMRSTVQIIANGVTRVGNFIKEHQTLARVIGTVVLGVGSFLAVMGAANLGLGALMWTIGSVVGTVLKLATAFRTVIVAFKALSLVLISNPIGLIITLIGGLIAAGVLLWQNWDTVKQKASELWTWFSTSFPGIADFVSSTFDKIGAFINDVKGIFGELTDFVSNVFSGEWGKAWENVTNIFSQVFGMLASIAKAPLNAVISLVNKVFELIGGVNVTLPDWIPGLGGKSFGFELPQIPMLAEGGIAQSPTLAMIGEGNEAEAVLPLSRLESLLKGGLQTSQTSVTEAPVTINFNPTINLQGQGGEVQQQVVQALQVSSEQIKRVIRDYFVQQRRLSYA